MNRVFTVTVWFVALSATFTLAVAAADLIPPAATIKADRPRLLLRPADTPYAVSLRQLRAVPHDADYRQMLKQIDGVKDRAATQAMVYLLTGKEEAARNAIRVLQSFKMPPASGRGNSPQAVWDHFGDAALAYDWLHVYPGFDEKIRREICEKIRPYAELGCKNGNDLVFCNYTWQYDGGAMLWALAAAGEDPAADRLLADLRQRFNKELFAAMEYLQGAQADGAGYWMRYCQNIAVFMALATQSAFETDVRDNVRRNHGDWLNRQLDLLALSVLPDMRYIPWGDTVVHLNGGVTHEMASRIDQFTWLTGSPHGAYLSRSLAGKRGLKRFYGDTAIYYFLYTRNLPVEPAEPSLAVRAGGDKGGGEVVMRSDWTDGATVVGFRCTDFFAQHLHYDQGSFIIYRNGMLAMDAGAYLHMNGAQIETSSQNTLLLGGRGQRPLKYQSSKTLAAFIDTLHSRKLATGDIPFYRDAGAWTAVAGQFAQAYEPDVIQSCLRQLLYVRPGTVVVVDRLSAPAGKSLPEVQWLLQTPGKPEVGPHTVTAKNAKSYLRCRALMPGCPDPKVDAAPDTAEGQDPAHVGNAPLVATSRCTFAYAGQPRMTLVHVLEVADGAPPAVGPGPKIELTASGGVKLLLYGKTYRFGAAAPFEVSEEK